MNLEDVREFCKHCHRHQTRWDGSPYAVHPQRVADRTAEILRGLSLPCEGRPTDDEILAAALLHDVIEDTGKDYEDVASRFGTSVADMVAVLSDDKRVPKDRRLAEYAAVLAGAAVWVQAVKLADLADNSLDMAGASARRRASWARSAMVLLSALGGVKHTAAWAEVHARLADAGG